MEQDPQSKLLKVLVAPIHNHIANEKPQSQETENTVGRGQPKGPIKLADVLAGPIGGILVVEVFLEAIAERTDRAEVHQTCDAAHGHRPSLYGRVILKGRYEGKHGDDASGRWHEEQTKDPERLRRLQPVSVYNVNKVVAGLPPRVRV